jgi:hypothetical protein
MGRLCGNEKGHCPPHLRAGECERCTCSKVRGVRTCGQSVEQEGSERKELPQPRIFAQRHVAERVSGRE